MDLEDAVGTLDELGGDTEPLLYLVRQTGGPGIVVSNYAVFDGDLGHRSRLPGLIIVRRSLGWASP